tara:strand:+ start:268 stop:681 length:414 start_codon:yes stop_codon:yes gene_type:complete
MKKILIMGLPGAGKTTLAKKIVSLIDAKWLNADEIRKKANDWDFSLEGRKRQAKRMLEIANKHKLEGHYVVADFICPTPESREIFKPDFIVWVDTIKKCKYEDTNIMFVPPENYDVRVTEKDSEFWSSNIVKKIRGM